VNARIIVEYRDAANQNALAIYDSGPLTPINVWQQVTNTTTAPVGTGWIRVRLFAINNLASSLNDFAFFDALSLRPVGATGTTLNGSVIDDGLPIGSELVISWTQVSGPAPVAFSNVGTPITSVAFSATGTYVLRLTANDSEFTTNDDVSITVNSLNQPPLANAGPDKTAALNANLIVNPGAEDPLQGGEIAGWIEKAGNWGLSSNVSVDGIQSFVGGGSPGANELRQDVNVSAFSSLIASGNLMFEFKASSRLAAQVGQANARIIVEYRDALNQTLLATYDSGLLSPNNVWQQVTNTTTAPVGTGWISVKLFAINNLTASFNNFALFDAISLSPLGIAKVTLNGTVQDDGLPAGSVMAVGWSQVSGPGPVTFSDPSSLSTMAGFTVSGTYVLRLTANDSQFTSTDDVIVTINPPN
jgi:hypothetical protein